MNSLQLEIVDCPLCHSTEQRSVVESADNQWGVPGRFAVTECRRCGHLFMNPRPTLDSIGDCYPDNYGPHQNLPGDTQSTSRTDTATAASEHAAVRPAGLDAVPQRPWYLRYLPLRSIPGLKRFYEWLLDDRSQWFPPPAQPASSTSSASVRRGFELGCAAGAYLMQLQERGWQVSGVEPGERPAAAARAAGLNVATGTLDSQPQDEQSFDFAASWMVIEHVPDPRTTLTQMFALLRPGGVLAISVPNAGCWEPRCFGSAWDAWDLPRHLHHFSPRSIRRLLTECGYTNIEVIHQRNVLNIIGSVGILLTRRSPHSRTGQWLLRYPHEPRLWLQLMLAPWTHLLAFLRQGGRLTVIARRPNLCERECPS